MGVTESDRGRHLARGLAAAVLAAGAVVGIGGTATASAEPCPDVQVVFARGTFEAPGPGYIGDAFVDALRAQPELVDKSVDVYPVNYPASLDFMAAADGVIDASNKLRSLSAACPDTKAVLGGYSQGAAVMGYVTQDSVPPGFTLPPGITGPMAPEVAKHVAAVALFGKPSNGFLNSLVREAPPVTVGPLYAAKTIDQCIPADPVCSPTGNDNAAHGAYIVDGMTDQAAGFAARLVASKTPGKPVELSGQHG